MSPGLLRPANLSKSLPHTTHLPGKLQIYPAEQMRFRRNPNIQSYKEGFERWKKDVNQWKKDIKKGHRTSEEFILWLEDSRKS